MKLTKDLPKILFVAGVASWTSFASATTVEDFMKWFEANQTAAVKFKDGDKITYENAELIRAFVPPGYQDEMIFEGMDVVVRDASDLSPPESYKKATQLHQSGVRVAEDGVLENYKAGLPFDPKTFIPGDRMSGYKAAWNFNFRWQYGGLAVDNVEWVWVRKGGSHDDHGWMKTEYAPYYQGGGTFERTLKGSYQRAYLSHRADLPETDYAEDHSWARDTEFREITDFSDPFDIDGTAFIVLRHNNPDKVDDGWAYIPNLRRVRRISAEVKQDSLLGTDLTIEDFYCFSGRVPDHEWKYIGAVRSLHVARSRSEHVNYYGPNGWAMKDDWELRTQDVYQQIPKASGHPYSSKIIFLDRQVSDAYYCTAYDQKGDLWKVLTRSMVWSEDPHYGGKDKTPKGVRLGAFSSINIIDKQNGRGTLVAGTGHYPEINIKKVKRDLDINTLTKGK